MRLLMDSNILRAREELKKLGPLSRNEKITAGALAVTVGLWIFGGQIGVNAVAAALLGLAVLLITNVVRCAFGPTVDVPCSYSWDPVQPACHAGAQHTTASALLASQPLPAQHRVGIVSGALHKPGSLLYLHRCRIALARPGEASVDARLDTGL